MAVEVPARDIAGGLEQPRSQRPAGRVEGRRLGQRFEERVLDGVLGEGRVAADLEVDEGMEGVDVQLVKARQGPAVPRGGSGKEAVFTFGHAREDGLSALADRSFS
jgi:hypothetical protein